MSSAKQISQPLVDGERLSRDEFMRRWEALPELKFAELLEGVVYLQSPLSLAHGSHHGLAVHWLFLYIGSTPGCDAGDNATWLMLEDAPQPDAFLRLLPEYGGQSTIEGEYASGAPELAVEVAASSASRDLGPKLRLYRKAGVQEYLTFLLKESRVIWRQLVEGAYMTIEEDSDGLLRSRVFPGLWLDPEAMLRRDVAQVVKVTNRGLRSTEHREFVKRLKAKKSSSR